MRKLILLTFAAIALMLASCTTAPAFDTPEIITGHPIAISAGMYNSMMVTSDGDLWGWGWYVNTLGATGVFHHDPVFILDDVVYAASITVGMQSTFALRSGGALWAWGHNNFGQLGNGSTTSQASPVHIIDNIAAFVTGETHTLALTTSGILYAWGGNVHGQLGIGSTTSVHSPVQVAENIAVISASRSHSLAVTNDGYLYAWGSNRHGQLGNSNTTDSHVPIQIKGGVVAIAAGYGHSLAVTDDGRLWAWGSNESGQLGNNNTEYSLLPVQIMDDVATVFADGNFSMAITASGSLYGWGCNYYGRLGNGTTVDSHYPVNIMYNVAEVSLNDGRVVVITGDGAVYSWGKYFIGYYLRDGIHYGRQPTPELVLNASGFYPSYMHMLGRWRVETGIPSLNYFTNYLFYPDNTGAASTTYLAGDTPQQVDFRPFVWELSQDRKLLIEFEDGEKLLARMELVHFHNSSGLFNRILLESDDEDMRLIRIMPGHLFEDVTIN